MKEFQKGVLDTVDCAWVLSTLLRQRRKSLRPLTKAPRFTGAGGTSTAVVPSLWITL